MKIFIVLNLFLFALLFEKISACIDRDWIPDRLFSNIKPKNLHCGSKDFTPKPGSNGKWSKNNLTYYIGSNSSSMSEDDARHGIRVAFNYWSAVVPLTFIEVDNEMADIWIGFRKGEHGDDLPFDGTDGQIAHCSGQMPCTAIHFDDDEKWRYVEMGKWLSGDMVDFFSVAMHQIGHALGLGHHDGHVTNIMNSRYRRPTNKDEIYDWVNLKPDDIKAVKELYGISTEYSYLACFIEGEDSLLNSTMQIREVYTEYEYNQEDNVFYCAHICSRDGYRYAGVETGKCYCGKELNLEYSENFYNETTCYEHLCSTDNIEFCGKTRALAVYTTPEKFN
uniref:WSC domain-containing protein n=1 Tax=Acrobeloides nanus TaxID=290746 RepID=A0A914CAV9_9BILA